MVAASAVSTLPAQAPPDTSGLQRLLQAELARFPGKATIWVKHLSSGVEAGVRADEGMNSASVIKIPVMVLAFQLADQSRLSLAERITITQADVRGGSGIFRCHDPGLQPTLRDVLLQMIITSDNTATDLAIAKVGGVARVNAWLAAQGYGDALKLNMTTGELFAKYGALPQGANRNEKTTGDKSYWLGEMSARATGRMLEAIQRCGSISSAARDLDMSYRRAWLLIDDLNQTFRQPVVSAVVGGRKGGGTGLTAFGETVIRHYREMEAEAEASLAHHMAALQEEVVTAGIDAPPRECPLPEDGSERGERERDCDGRKAMQRSLSKQPAGRLN